MVVRFGKEQRTLEIVYKCTSMVSEENIKHKMTKATTSEELWNTTKQIGLPIVGRNKKKRKWIDDTLRKP
jgi:hypothetical protein